MADRGISPARIESIRGKEHSHTWGMKNEEYVADFCLTAERTLNRVEHQIFRFHFLLGADWKLCCRRLKLDRGNFFHYVYRIEHKLGRVFRELQPYALFPLRDYFSQSNEDGVRPCAIPVPRRYHLDPPLRKVA